MNVVEQSGQFLHFVHNDPGASGECLDFAAKQARLAHKAQQLVIEQKVVPMPMRKCLAQPSSLSDPTGPEEQEGTCGQQ